MPGLWKGRRNTKARPSIPLENISLRLSSIRNLSIFSKNCIRTPVVNSKLFTCLLSVVSKWEKLKIVRNICKSTNKPSKMWKF